MATPTFYNTEIARIAGALWGVKLGNASMNSVLNSVNAVGLAKVANDAYNASFGSASNATVAAIVVANVGITGPSAAGAIAAVTSALNAAPAGGKGAALTTLLATFANMTADPTYGAAATAFNANVASALTYSQTAGNVDGTFVAAVVTTFALGLGQDALTGSAGDDVFNARIVDNLNTLQSGDSVNGGAGSDTLNADMGSSQLFSVTPETTGIETFTVRAQSRANDSGDNNVSFLARVNIDAERMVGVNRFESNNSRADVIIEDVRILPSQITSDITIAMVETDPGHVDFGVYFDQYSLRNQSSATSSITLQIMDTAAAARGQAPLLNSNYGAFTFTITEAGVSRVITLGADATGRPLRGPGTIQDAQTYDELRIAFQTELNKVFPPAGTATATLGAPFTVVDPVSRSSVTGTTVVLTVASAIVINPEAAGSGWLADGVSPAESNLYTDFVIGGTVSTGLVTSKIILDDVGRGSTGGDLVIGGLSTGFTSSSLGVQRFEIEVRDNSKLESINSTNNTLREVTVTNGVTSNAGNAYVTTVKDAGNLTVNGQSGPNGANVSGFSNRIAVVPNAPDNTFSLLPGVASRSASGQVLTAGQVETYGFTDVRLIDASAMRGKLEMTAQVTSASLVKYLNLTDIQALPAGDNVAFTYNGGTVDDTLWVSLDSLATASRNTIMAGREDFTFTANGGAGNDNITVFVGPSPLTAANPLIGGHQAWYTNQKLNKNITINGGDGNDTIRKPGAGDVAINGGTGADTIYADNSGFQGGTAGTDSTAGAVYSAAEAAELAAAQALINLANTTNGGPNDAPGLGFFGNPNPLAQPDDTVAALNTLNLLTPVTFTDPANAANPLVLAHATLKTAIDNAYAAGALTVQQQSALYVAYNVASAGTVVTPATLAAPPDITDEVAVAGNLTAAEMAAGNAVLDGYIVAALAAAATADAANARVATQAGLLNATQLAVVNAQLAVNGVAGFEANSVVAGVTLGGNGTATILNGLTSLRTTLVLTATDAVVLAALVAARDAQIITPAQATALQAASGGGGPPAVDAAELFQIQVILEPLIAAAAVANTTANATLTAAIAANNAAVSTAAGIVGADPVTAAASAVANDFVGSTEAAAAAAAAATALSTFTNTTLNPSLAVQTALAALKAAIAVGVSDLNVTLLTTAAVGNLAITAGDKIAIDNASGATPTAAADTVDLTEKNAVDVLINALQVTNNAAVAQNQAEAATLTAIRTATAFASAQAAAAAAAAPGGGLNVTPDKAVFVLNTANQLDVTTTPGTGYVLAVNDERNVADLKSGANDSYNMFNTTVTVTFKDIVATAVVPNTGYRTTDLQINQAIKDAINNNAVLNKLLVATDGPANTLVVTSLIDGVMATTNLSVTLAMPAVGSVSTTDIAAAAAVYGLPSSPVPTEADVLAVLAAAQTAFNTRGDYVDQLAETGAFGGNVRVTGAASITTSDNTITGGDGNDVIVLGTTSGIDALLSSNDTVVFAAGFGNDTVVHFRAGALATGGDVLNLSGLGGGTFGTAFNVNRSVNVATEAAASNGTAALVAALFVDSTTTAQTHVYVAVDALTNIGKVYSVVDAAGVGGVTATLAGTIDLADTLWATLTAENFS